MTTLQCRSVSEALKELDTTARSGARLASRWTWPRQSGLSPRGRSYHRLDRSPDNRKERPLTASWRLLMVRRLCDAGPLSLETLRKRSMPLTDLVAPNAIIPALKVQSKKQVLQELAAKAAELCGQSERTILEILQQREKLGSTGVGNGIAIPHGKLPKLTKLFGLFARLERPVDFEALDGQPVDLVFLLLAPEAAGADHLKALARVARLLRDADVARKLRDSRDAEALYAVLAMPSASAA